MAGSRRGCVGLAILPIQGAVMMDWQIISGVLGLMVTALGGIIWTRVSGDLARVSDSLQAVSVALAGHGILFDFLELDK